MATITHASLTGSDLHEPKGAASANSGEIYIADGAGSGAWTNKSTLIPGSTYGGMYIDGNVTATAIASANTYVQVTAGWAESSTSGITFSTDKFVIVTTGIYWVGATISFEGNANDTYAFDIGINTGAGLAALAQGAIRRKTASADVGALAVQGLISLTAGNEIGILVLNETDTDDPTITDANLSVLRVA